MTRGVNRGAPMVLLAAALAGCVAPRDGADADSIAVRSVVEGIIAADNRRALDRVLAYYADSAILMPPGADPVVGRATIRPRYRALFDSYDPAIVGRVDELVVAGRWAWVRGHNGGVLRGRSGAPDRPLNDDYLMILARQAGAWRIARLMWHPAPPAPESERP